MVFRPRSEDEVYESLRSRLTGKIESLTNFIEGSFNYVWTRAFAQGIRENELQATAAQLSGWIDYAGGPITQSDLDDLGLDNVDVEELNEYINEEDLDQLVSIVGLQRDEGTKALGTVTVTTTEGGTAIPEGTRFGTQPDTHGNFLAYETTSDVEVPSGETEAVVEVEAEEIGERYNVGAGSITYMPDPPAGVQSVNNYDSIAGGVDRETNEQLRERAREAVFATTGGGTAAGVRGYIQQNTEAQDVLIDEFTDVQPPYVDVIVDGDEDQAILDAIAYSKPVGVRHNLVRPTNFSARITVELLGDDINTARVENSIIEHINELGVSDNLYRGRLVQVAMNADVDIENVERLDISINGETHEYSSGQDTYTLLKGDQMDEEAGTEIRGTLGGNTHTFVEGTDYTVTDGVVDWGVGGDNPDDGTDFFVDYQMDYDLDVDSREKVIAGIVEASVV